MSKRSNLPALAAAMRHLARGYARQGAIVRAMRVTALAVALDHTAAGDRQGRVIALAEARGLRSVEKRA